jgi:hypothetical protein
MSPGPETADREPLMRLASVNPIASGRWLGLRSLLLLGLKAITHAGFGE